jgi:hypothetical protein
LGGIGAGKVTSLLFRFLSLPMPDPIDKPFAVPSPVNKPSTLSSTDNTFVAPAPVKKSPGPTASSNTSSPQQPPPLKYDKPDWGDVASFDYSLEVLKGGLSIEKIQGPRKDFITIGNKTSYHFPL